MKIKNFIRLEFPSLSINESYARSAAAAFVAQLDPTLEELDDIRTAVSEAVTNCIVHAYPEAVGKISLRLGICEGGRFEIRVRDWGRGIENIDEAMQPMYTTGGDERSGMGFTIMESFMDTLSVKSVPNKGTTVIMRRTIRRRESDR